MLRFHFIAVGCFLGSTLLSTSAASADHADCSLCGGTGTCEQTVDVCVTEMRTVLKTCFRDEERVEIRQVPRTITIEKEVPYKYKTWVRVKKVDVQEMEIKTPKFRWVEQKYTVNVPGKETVVKTKKHTQCVPVTKVEMVTEDQGHFEIQMVASETCGGCLCTEKKVWCPNPVQVAKETTVMETVTVEEPYVCEIPLIVPIEKTRKTKEYFTATEKKKIEHPYFTLEHKERTKMVTAMIPETVYDEVPEVCVVKVPYTVEVEVPVPVTRKIRQSVPCRCGH